MRVRTLILVACAAALAAAGDVGAQEDGGTLGRVERLSQLGKADDARSLLLSWWDSAGSSASRADRQRALWLRGCLTVDPSQAEIDFRRLVIEFPGGAYSGRALLRLAQSAYVAGDGGEARQRVAELERNYPGSRVSHEARTWLQQVGEPPPPVRPPPADTASRTPPRSSAAEQEGSWAVQLGAFSQASRARSLAERARRAGLEPRMVHVPGSRLVRVRVGRFTSDEPARQLLKRVQGLGFQAALVRDADKEEH